MLILKMPKKYIKRKTCKYTEEDLIKATKLVTTDGLTLRQVAKQFNIPASTLSDHVRTKVSKIGAGRPTILTAKEEKEIVNICQVCELGV